MTLEERLRAMTVAERQAWLQRYLDHLKLAHENDEINDEELKLMGDRKRKWIADIDASVLQIHPLEK